jgi:hypothetical protein
MVPLATRVLSGEAGLSVLRFDTGMVGRGLAVVFFHFNAS